MQLACRVKRTECISPARSEARRHLFCHIGGQNAPVLPDEGAGSQGICALIVERTQGGVLPVQAWCQGLGIGASQKVGHPYG